MATNRQYQVPNGFINEKTNTYEYVLPFGFINETTAAAAAAAIGQFLMMLGVGS